jgi:hypothetical protein
VGVSPRASTFTPISSMICANERSDGHNNSRTRKRKSNWIFYCCSTDAWLSGHPSVSPLQMMGHFYFAKFVTTSQTIGAMLLDYSIGIAPPDRSNLLTPPNPSHIAGILLKSSIERIITTQPRSQRIPNRLQHPLIVTWHHLHKLRHHLIPIRQH